VSETHAHAFLSVYLIGLWHAQVMLLAATISFREARGKVRHDMIVSKLQCRRMSVKPTLHLLLLSPRNLPFATEVG
jgi:hypothetical protein